MREELEKLKKEFKEGHTAKMIFKYCPHSLATIMVSTILLILGTAYVIGRQDEMDRREKQLDKKIEKRKTK